MNGDATQDTDSAMQTQPQDGLDSLPDTRTEGEQVVDAQDQGSDGESRKTTKADLDKRLTDTTEALHQAQAELTTTKQTIAELRDSFAEMRGEVRARLGGTQEEEVVDPVSDAVWTEEFIEKSELTPAQAQTIRALIDKQNKFFADTLAKRDVALKAEYSGRLAEVIDPQRAQYQDVIDDMEQKHAWFRKLSSKDKIAAAKDFKSTMPRSSLHPPMSPDGSRRIPAAPREDQRKKNADALAARLFPDHKQTNIMRPDLVEAK